MHIAALFVPEPRQFGLRGDAYLWDAMRRSLQGEGLPQTAQELADVLTAAFASITGHALTESEDFFVQEFAHGGMSSGMVCVTFWQAEALPLLMRRFSDATRDAATPPQRNQSKRPASESIAWLLEAVRRLPSDAPVPDGRPGYATYNTQKDHWIGWLDPRATPRAYPCRSARDAREVYNRIVEPKLLVWLIAAAGVRADLFDLALRDAEEAPKQAGKSAAIRRHVP